MHDDMVEQCAKIAEAGAKDCCEGESEWHRTFRYAATNTALQIASRIRALKSQSDDRQKEAADAMAKGA